MFRSLTNFSHHFLFFEVMGSKGTLRKREKGNQATLAHQGLSHKRQLKAPTKEVTLFVTFINETTLALNGTKRVRELFSLLLKLGSQLLS